MFSSLKTVQFAKTRWSLRESYLVGTISISSVSFNSFRVGARIVLCADKRSNTPAKAVTQGGAELSRGKEIRRGNVREGPKRRGESFSESHLERIHSLKLRDLSEGEEDNRLSSRTG